jgi:two-component system, NtrC family, response regulator AtoC
MAREQAASNSALHDADPVHEASARAAVRGRRRHVVLVCADQVLARDLQRGLERCDAQTTLVADADAAAAVTIDCDAIVFDLGCVDARRHLRQLREATCLPLVAVLGLGSRSAGQEEAIACGAQLLARPISHGALAAALRRALVEQRRRELLAYHQQRESRQAGLAHLIGESAPMLRLRAKLALLLDLQWQTPTEAQRAVLLHGECGTGKSRIARALHGDGPRGGAAFVVFDAHGLSAIDIEARLFGAGRHGLHSSQARDIGLLARAEGGTLFIREIADIALPVQARLSEWIEAALQETGAGWAAAHDVLLIAASRRSPEQLAASGALWPALAASLAASTFALPPLRERGDDACVLARRFMHALAEHRGLPVPSWGRTVGPALLRHRWPGNVRELRHAMEHALLVQRDGTIDGADLRLDPLPARNAPAPAADLELGRIEHDALTRALERARGNVSQAARLLGITRDTLRYRMTKQGLSRAAGHRVGAATP